MHGSAPPRTYGVRMSEQVTGFIRVRTLCVFSHNGLILAMAAHDPTKGEDFWVPIGGRVEFRETAEEALRREVREELSAEVADIELLSVVENLFTFDGGEGHEITFIHDGRFEDASLYGTDLTVVETTGQTLAAKWIDPAAPDFGWPLYPDGLAELFASR
jgi:ADP-ribose pyrophosphatase YjhB (NUDIX family)